jgi:hypothetical protein
MIRKIAKNVLAAAAAGAHKKSGKSVEEAEVETKFLL